MKKKKRKGYQIGRLILLFVIIMLGACGDDDEIEPLSFLADLRPQYFEYLNFNSRETVLKLPQYLNEFTHTYEHLESEYERGLYTSEADLNNMRLASMYYSFLITAITKAYLDDLLSFDDIIGDRTSDFFSDVELEDPNFEDKELRSMMQRAEEVASFGVEVNQYNDRLQGTYLAAKQIAGRLDADHYENDPDIQKEMISYVSSIMEDFEIFSQWNVAISQIFFDNYSDPLNTYFNPEMHVVYNNIINRLNPNFLPVINSSFNSLISPIYHFDAAMKRADWAINRQEQLTPNEIMEIGSYVTRMDMISQNIQTQRQDLLNVWEYKNTFDSRLEKLEEVKTFFNAASSGVTLPKPQIAPFMDSKEFRQAYQCYSCHKPTNL